MSNSNDLIAFIASKLHEFQGFQEKLHKNHQEQIQEIQDPQENHQEQIQENQDPQEKNQDDHGVGENPLHGQGLAKKKVRPTAAGGAAPIGAAGQEVSGADLVPGAQAPTPGQGDQALRQAGAPRQAAPSAPEVLVEAGADFLVPGAQAPRPGQRDQARQAGAPRQAAPNAPEVLVEAGANLVPVAQAPTPGQGDQAPRQECQAEAPRQAAPSAPGTGQAVTTSLNTNAWARPGRTFAQAVKAASEFDAYDLPLPFKIGEKLAVKIPEEAYRAGLEVCQSSLHGRLILSKGDTPPKFAELQQKLRILWSSIGNWSMIILGKGYFEFKFASKDDMAKICAKTTWGLKPGILKLFMWTPDFKPQNQRLSQAQCWMRIYDLPQEYWHHISLLSIAKCIGTPIALDQSTSNRSFGVYARVLVEIDLKQKPPDDLIIEREGFSFIVNIEYENLPDFCSHCFSIGHSFSVCRKLQAENQANANNGQKDKSTVPEDHMVRPTQDDVPMPGSLAETALLGRPAEAALPGRPAEAAQPGRLTHVLPGQQPRRPALPAQSVPSLPRLPAQPDPPSLPRPPDQTPSPPRRPALPAQSVPSLPRLPASDPPSLPGLPASCPPRLPPQPDAPSQPRLPTPAPPSHAQPRLSDQASPAEPGPRLIDQNPAENLEIPVSEISIHPIPMDDILDEVITQSYQNMTNLAAAHDTRLLAKFWGDEVSDQEEESFTPVVTKKMTRNKNRQPNERTYYTRQRRKR